ncbi:MAG: sulfatase-like hydrolase/transferase, partial [Spirochaetales bacterium]|nr:sulfatase-like hydrolase/transferase [Spirochaetales bacterium]
MADTRTNILIIMTDQHNRNFMGAAGNNLVRTPNLDALASEGTRFTNAYCPSPLCVPSRMSFMTGMYPSKNRVWNNSHILSSGIPTWAHILSSAGYDTALIGRMHFEGPDQRHGFESRPIGGPKAGHPGVPSLGGPAWTRFPGSTSGQSRVSVETAGRGKTHYQWQDEERTKAAVSYLRDRSTEDTDRPFAALVGYTLPHCPFVAPKELFDYYYDRVEIPEREEHLPAAVSRYLDYREILDPPLEPERVRVALAAYYGLCEHIDALIGEVLSCLEDCGFTDNTMVVYCSDHGEQAGQHGCWWKSTYYEGSAGVPLLVKWPGISAENSVKEDICNLIDLAPTFADAAKTEFPYPIDGRSLLPVLNGSLKVDWDNTTFSEL